MICEASQGSCVLLPWYSLHNFNFIYGLCVGKAPPLSILTMSVLVPKRSSHQTFTTNWDGAVAEEVEARIRQKQKENS